MSYLCNVKEKGQQPNPLTPAFYDKAKAPKGKGEATADGQHGSQHTAAEVCLPLGGWGGLEDPTISQRELTQTLSKT